MVMGKNVSKYEAIREQRMAENKKKMEELHLPILTQALKSVSFPKPLPLKMKKTTPRVAKTELVPVRRSIRFTNKTAPQDKEMYASDEARERAVGKANELVRKLGSDSLTFVRSILPSHVSGSGRFWLGLSASMSGGLLPKNDGEITLVDEEREEWPVTHLQARPRRPGNGPGA